MRHLFLTLCITFPSLSSCDSNAKDEPMQWHTDAGDLDSSLHCESYYAWCEEGIVYRGFPDYAHCDMGQTCGTSEPWDDLVMQEVCNNGCAENPGDTACRWIESPDVPDEGSSFCKDG